MDTKNIGDIHTKSTRQAAQQHLRRQTYIYEDTTDRTRNYQGEGMMQLLLHRHIVEGAQEHVLRTRNEVIQHAKVLKYVIEAVIRGMEVFGKQMVMETHRILGPRGQSSKVQNAMAVICKNIP